MKIYVESTTTNFLGVSEGNGSVDYHRPQEVFQVNGLPLMQKIRQMAARLKQCVIQNGNLIDVLPDVFISNLMQLIVSNGNYYGYALNLPLINRQIDIIPDLIYDTLIEIAIIRNTATGAIDIWHRENEGPMPADYELVQSLIKFTLPAGTSDLSTLNIL